MAAWLWAGSTASQWCTASGVYQLTLARVEAYVMTVIGNRPTQAYCDHNEGAPKNMCVKPRG